MEADPGVGREVIRRPGGACGPARVPLAEVKSGKGMPHHAKWVRSPGVANSLSVPVVKGRYASGRLGDCLNVPIFC